MNKVLVVILLMLVTVSINIVVASHLVKKNSPAIQTAKVVVVDQADLLEKLKGQGNQIQSIKDYNNIMTLLQARGFVVINKRHVLSHSSQYDLPTVNMPLVESMLRKKGIPLMTDEAAQARLDKAASMLQQDFNLSL